jgi:hypothetical protein
VRTGEMEDGGGDDYLDDEENAAYAEGAREDRDAAGFYDDEDGRDGRRPRSAGGRSERSDARSGYSRPSTRGSDLSRGDGDGDDDAESRGSGSGSGDEDDGEDEDGSGGGGSGDEDAGELLRTAHHVDGKYLAIKVFEDENENGEPLIAFEVVFPLKSQRWTIFADPLKVGLQPGAWEGMPTQEKQDLLVLMLDELEW